MTTHLDYLRAIIANMVHEQPPGKLLIGAKANRWAAAYPFSRAKLSGERVGVRHEGVINASKLAISLAKESPQYHRGVRWRTLTDAILETSIDKFTERAADSLVAGDLTTLKTAIAEWFKENDEPRTYIVPCSILPDLDRIPNAKPFSVGPVAFSHVSDFLKARDLSDPAERFLEEMQYRPMLQAMNERRATWIAEVEIDGCERTKASEIANLAVDIALVGVQLVIPASYSRGMARITGRTIPPFVGTLYREGPHVGGGWRSCYPGLGLSGGVFDEWKSKQVAVTQSVGRRVEAYVSGKAELPNLAQAWCDAAYWFHEGLAETLDSIAVTKLETAIEVLLGAESSSGSKKRLCEALHAFFGLKETAPIATDPSVSIKQYVKGIVGPRSRFLHGTWSTLTENAEATRANVEGLSFELLRRSSLALDGYAASATPVDSAGAFLAWVDAERQAGASQP
jgi:hypothetical protein